MSTPLSAEVVVSTIDTNDAWFSQIVSDNVALPGKNRAVAAPDKAPNEITRAQAGVVVRGLQAESELASLTLAEACDVARGRNYARLNGRQYDFNMVNYFATKANEQNADEELTTGQLAMIDAHVKAMLGTEAHFRPETEAAIQRLSDSDKERFIREFEDCETRGDLTKVMRAYERRVPNPAASGRNTQSAAQQAVADLNIEDEDDSF